MDKRINYLIGLDTETCNGILTNDKLDLSQSIVYDIGWTITDKKGVKSMDGKKSLFAIA